MSGSNPLFRVDDVFGDDVFGDRETAELNEALTDAGDILDDADEEVDDIVDDIEAETDDTDGDLGDALDEADERIDDIANDVTDAADEADQNVDDLFEDIDEQIENEADDSTDGGDTGDGATDDGNVDGGATDGGGTDGGATDGGDTDGGDTDGGDTDGGDTDGGDTGGGVTDGGSGGGAPTPAPVTAQTAAALILPANNSGVLGFAVASLDGNVLNVNVVAANTTPGQVHPLHIHGFTDGRTERLPTAQDDLDGDGVGETPEGEGAAFGPVIAGLTTTGEAQQGLEVSPDFPLADATGKIVFSQSYTLDAAEVDDASILSVLQDRLGGRVIELHGVNVPAGLGAGTPNEANGTAGYNPQVPVAAGQLLALPAGEEGEDGFAELIAADPAAALAEINAFFTALAPHTLRPDGTGPQAPDPFFAAPVPSPAAGAGATPPATGTVPAGTGAVPGPAETGAAAGGATAPAADASAAGTGQAGATAGSSAVPAAPGQQNSSTTGGTNVGTGDGTSNTVSQENSVAVGGTNAGNTSNVIGQENSATIGGGNSGGTTNTVSQGNAATIGGTGGGATDGGDAGAGDDGNDGDAGAGDDGSDGDAGGNGGNTDGDGGGDAGGGAGEEAGERYTVLLLPTNNSGVFGAAEIVFDEAAGTLSIDMDVTGLEAGLKHATHIHGFTDDRASIIPNLQVDTDRDGFLEDPEATPYIGPVLLGITEDGTISDAALTANYEEADEDGRVSLEQTYSFDLGNVDQAALFKELGDRLEGRVLQVHGQTVPATNGEGTRGEVDGTAGYKPLLAVANGVILDADAPGGAFASALGQAVQDGLDNGEVDLAALEAVLSAAAGGGAASGATVPAGTAVDPNATVNAGMGDMLIG